MLIYSIRKKALIISAFFIYSLFINLFSSVQANTLTTDCQTRQFDQTAQVIKIYDGDTFKTDKGEKIRLIGINTPETGQQDKPSQPMANEAKQALTALLATSKYKVGLRFGQDKHDRYKRILAHVYLPNGTNLQEQLLAEGLAAHIVIPPNTNHLECYQRAELSARQQHKGMWSLPAYKYKMTTSLKSADTGFQFITGDVVFIGQSKKAIWLNLTGKIALRISKDDLHYFDKDILENIVGKKIQARGWLLYNKKRKELFMHMQHPASMKIIQTTP